MSGDGAAGRREDARLLTGQGRFTADDFLPGVAHAVLVRAPHAHADIVTIDCEAARAMPDVIAVFTAADLAADGIGPIPGGVPGRAPTGHRRRPIGPFSRAIAFVSSAKRWR